MTPEIERFVELASRPLEGCPEERERAKSELFGRLGHQGIPMELLDLAGPVGRLEEKVPRRPGPRRIMVITCLALLLLMGGWLVGGFAHQVVMVFQAQMLPTRGWARSCRALPTETSTRGGWNRTPGRAISATGRTARRMP